MTTLRQFNDKLQANEVRRCCRDKSDALLLTDACADARRAQSARLSAVSAVDLIALEQVVHVVQETAFYHSSTFAAAEMRVLTSLVLSWPADVVFPALDLLRLVLVHPQGPSALGGAALVDIVGRMLQLGLQEATASGDDVPAATRMLALRVLANMFLQDAGRKALLARKTEVRD